MNGRDSSCGDPESEYLDLGPGEAFDQLVGASIHYRIAIGPNAGKKALMLRTIDPIAHECKQSQHKVILPQMCNHICHARTETC